MRTHSVEQERNTRNFEDFLAAYFCKEAEHDTDSLAGIVEGHTTEEIAEALIALPAGERLIFALHYFEELTSEEICKVLDVDEAKLSRLTSSAFILLRRELDRSGLST